MSGDLGRLALNAAFVKPQMGGMVTYARRLVEGIVLAEPSLRLTVIASDEGRPVFAGEAWSDRVEIVGHPLLGRRFVSAATEVALVSRIARAARADVLHSLAMTGPITTRLPHVVTVPDLIWMRYPSSGRLTVATWKALVPRIARSATRVITFSQASKEEITRELGVGARRVDVVPLAADDRESADTLSSTEVRDRFSLGEGPIVLSVSSLRPHKNLERLVRAMGLLRKRSSHAVLVIPGGHTEHADLLLRVANEVGADVRLPGWISAAELDGLYATSACVALPSLQEGFGLPILEAMRRGVPVACSDVSSLPEVAGGAAEYFDPSDVDSIAAAIARVLSTADYAAALVRAGHERAAGFTWSAVAVAHLACYRRALVGLG